MNSKETQTNQSDDYKSLLVLDEISRNETLTQRDLSKKLGVALGLVNSYIKNLAAKGFITIATIPRKRYKYYLTTQGFTEKTRLTYRHLQNFTNLYRVARNDFQLLFDMVKKNPETQRIVFCGVDEVSEIAYISLKEAGLELSGIIDDASAGQKFFGLDVAPVSAIKNMDADLVIITAFKGSSELKTALLNAGCAIEKIRDIHGAGWLRAIEK